MNLQSSGDHEIEQQNIDKLVKRLRQKGLRYQVISSHVFCNGHEIKACGKELEIYYSLDDKYRKNPMSIDWVIYVVYTRKKETLEKGRHCGNLIITGTLGWLSTNAKNSETHD